MIFLVLLTSERLYPTTAMKSLQAKLYASILGLSVVVAVPARAVECSLPPTPTSPCIENGTDYLQTGAGTVFDFGPPIGLVEFVGNPIIAGTTTDTIIQRQADGNIGAPIPIQIINLSLVSKNPVSVGGNSYNVFVTLDPAKLALDTGTITVFGNILGGTFNSTLTVNFIASFAPIGGAPPMGPIPGTVNLTQNGGIWSPCAGYSPTPTLPLPANSVCLVAPAAPFYLVHGTDDGAAPPLVDELTANTHTDFPAPPNPFFPSYLDTSEVDFSPVIINELHFPPGSPGTPTVHSVAPACIIKVNPPTDIAGGVTNPQFAGTAGSCPTGWICGGSPAPGVASYTPGTAQYPSGPLFPTSSSSPTVLSGSGVIRQNTSLNWVAGQTYLLNFYAGLPKTEPDGISPVAGWPQTVRVYLTAGPGFAQVAAFDIPSPGAGNFVSNLLKFPLSSNSPFVGQSIGILIFVNGSPNGFSANFDIATAPCDP